MQQARAHILILFVTIFSLLESNFSWGGTIVFTASRDGVRLFEVTKQGTEKNSEKKFDEIIAPWKIEMKKDESRLFVFEKAGYMPVYVPIYYNPDHEVNVQVDLKKMDGETKTQMMAPVLTLADELVDEIIFTQHMIEEKKYVDALNKAEQLYTLHPQSISVKILYANTLLTNKQYQKADSIYTTILEEVPASKDAIRKSIENLRARIRGSARLPASASQQGANQKKVKTP